MSETVSFTRMSDGTADDYSLLSRYEDADLAAFPDRVLGWLRSMDEHTGYQTRSVLIFVSFWCNC